MSRKEYWEEREENLKECAEETAEEQPASSKGKSSRLGKEAKIGAAVILLLSAVFVAVVIVRLVQSRSGGAPAAAAGRNVAKGKAGRTATTAKEVQRPASTIKPPPTIVPAKAAPTAPPFFPDLPKFSPSERVGNRASAPPLGLGRADRFAADPPSELTRPDRRAADRPPRTTIPKAADDSGFASAGDAAAPSLAPPPLPPSTRENRRYAHEDRGDSRRSTDSSSSSSYDSRSQPNNDSRANSQRQYSPNSDSRADSQRQYPSNGDDRTDLKRPTRQAPPEPPADRTTTVGRGSYRVERRYKVKDGDTLFIIARYELGRASRWVEVYDRNHDQLGDDFNNLKPGMTLVLPDAEKSDRVAEPPAETRWR